MTNFYYYLVLLNAAVSLVAAGVVYWKNRFHAVGPFLGATFFILGVWLGCFAQYYRSLDETRALWWAHVTLFWSIANHPFYFHGMCALAGKMRRFRWWIVIVYAMGIMFLVLLWRGYLITGLRQAPFMEHYVRYDRFWYPFLSLFILSSGLFGFWVLITTARSSPGYQRTQLVYFMVASFIVFLTTDSVILPLEYNINMPPFGLFVLPVNLAFLAYVLSKARLVDYNVVIARAFLYAITMTMVVGVSLLFVGGVTLLAPGFMNQQQELFSVMLSTVVGIGLTLGLPRMLPRAERLMQERLFGSRNTYQDTLSGLVRELSHFSSIDQVLSTVASRIHSEMQVVRVLLLTRDELTDLYQVQAESGLTEEERTIPAELTQNAAIVQWLKANQDVLVRDELPRRTDERRLQVLEMELERLKTALCTPLFLESQLIGILCLGKKANRERFFDSDIRLLGSLAAELALAIKYRRMEEQITRKNKLVELGTIAAGVAHEIRNPLASIRTFAQLLPEKIGDPEFEQEFSKLVLKDVERITKVIESMLAFARPAQVTIAEHAAAELVEEATLLANSRLKSKRIEVVKQFHENPVLRVDKQQIVQVLLNLLNNAVDALPEQGRIRVIIGTRLMEGASDHRDHQRFAVIEVADNGPGIPATVRNRLFDPFFTTKRDGTGLGLSISQKIARDHGGIITVSSIEGKGTSFQINLPLI